MATNPPPRVEDGLFLRSSAWLRRAALRDLAALSADAWERRVALPWLVRLSFEVPAELLPELPAEERDFIMETREWYEQTLKQAEERGLERGQLRMTARMCGMRLGRPLTEVEHAALASLLDRLGEDRVGNVVLSFPVEALAAWITDPNAQ